MHWRSHASSRLKGTTAAKIPIVSQNNTEHQVNLNIPDQRLGGHGMRFMRFSLFMTLAITAVCVSAYGADITLLGTRAAFNGESSGVTTITFEGITATNAAQNFLNPGLVTSGVTFSTSGTGPFGPGFVTVYGAALAGMQSSVLNTGTGAILVWVRPTSRVQCFSTLRCPPELPLSAQTFGLSSRSSHL